MTWQHVGLVCIGLALFFAGYWNGRIGEREADKRRRLAAMAKRIEDAKQRGWLPE